MELASHMKIREVDVAGSKKSKLKGSETVTCLPVVLVFELDS